MITTITVLERLWYITDPGGMLLYTIIGRYGSYCISDLSNWILKVTFINIKSITTFTLDLALTTHMPKGSP